jgi:serine/threonine protein kinase
MFCPQCRTELPDDAKYCVKCGYDFSKIKTPPSRKSTQDSLDGSRTSIQQETDIDSFKVGIRFADRYEILSEGQRGGMGVVYKCKDTMLNGKTKALKVIHPRLLSSRQALSRFRQEVAISQELNHENIVRVYDIEEAGGKEYFTMEWVEGVSLREVITERKKEKRPFSIEEAYKIISQLSDALHHAHRQTIHRDIKPENILITGGAEQKVKLTDFGIAKMLSPSEFTSTSMQMGTPYYMAPEQKVDAANVDKRADIYASGVVLFELLTLENTIGFELPSEINKDLPLIMDTVIRKAVATKPNDRYGDASELAEALKKVVERFSDQADRSRREAEAQKRREEEQLRREAEERKQREAAQKKREEEEKERQAREKEEAEQKRVEEQKRRAEEQRRKTVGTERIRITETNGQRKSFSWINKAIAAVAVLAVLAGIYAYKSRRDLPKEPEMSSSRVETPAPYGYDMVPGKGWVPTPAPAPDPRPAPVEAPTPSSVPAKTIGYVQPIVKNLRPSILGEDGRGRPSFKPGQTVQLVIRYDIIMPNTSEIKVVEVVEYNTLVAPDGNKIDNPALTRTKMRQVGGVESAIQVKLPAGMPDGTYTHIAIVRIKDKEYKVEQKILIL